MKGKKYQHKINSKWHRTGFLIILLFIIFGPFIYIFRMIWYKHEKKEVTDP